MAKGILIAAMDFSNVAEDEFNDWYDTEHVPERQRVPGFLVCQRWIGADNPKQSVATYDLENLSVLQSPAYRAIGGENLSPWSKRVTGRVQRLVRFEGDQIAHFFRHYKDLEAGKWVNIARWADAEEAAALIAAAITRAAG